MFLQLVGGGGGGSGALTLRRGLGTGGSVADYFQNTGAVAVGKAGYWQVLEIREEPGNPGVFLLWVFTSGNRVQSIRLSAQRTIYVNALKDDAMAGVGGKVVKKTLPRKAPVANLYEISMSERRFQRNSKEIMRMMTDPAIQGVYETKVRMLLWLGVVPLNLKCFWTMFYTDAANPPRVDERWLRVPSV